MNSETVCSLDASIETPLLVDATPRPAQDPLLREFTHRFTQITRHSAVFLAGTLFTMATGYFVKIYVVRILGAELLGIYALGMTLVSFVQLFGLVGLPGTAARYVAVYNATGRVADLRAFLVKISAFVVVSNLCLALLVVLRGSWIAKTFYHSMGLGRYMLLFAVLGWLGALSVFLSQVLAGYKDVARRTVITNFVGTPLIMLLTVILLASGMSLWGYLTAQVIGTAIVVILLMRDAWKFTPAPARVLTSPLPALSPEIFSFSAASFAMTGIDFLATQADKILIGFYMAAKSVGVYVLATTLAAFVPLILQSVNQIFAPIIADLHAVERNDVLKELFQTLTKWVLASTLPGAVTIILFSPQLMRLFGPEFEKGWPVLAIVAAGQVINCAVGSVGYLLLMSGKQNRLMRVQFVMAMVSVVVNLSLIPVFGITGAAIAAASVNCGGNIWNLIEVRKSLCIWPYNRSYYRLAFPAGLMIVSLAVLKWSTRSVESQWLVLLLALILGYGVFAVAVLLVGMDHHDRTIASDYWQQMRGGLQKIRSHLLKWNFA